MSDDARVPGLFTLVLHTHLPWLAHHGRWPVGEEWLYQSWSASYLPLTRVLRRLAGEGRDHLLTLGMTPVVTAQLDDPYCLTGMHSWLANWQLRALEAATLRASSDTTPACTPEALRAFGVREQGEAELALEEFATLWRHGGSPLLRELVDAGTVELLGGPLAHPFQPLLNPRLREFALREGLADAGQRFAHTPRGIWAPECAYAPGMEADYAAAGVGHFMVDGPSLHGDTALGRPVGHSGVVAFGRDLQVSYRVWSPKSGYPGHAAYRDFHTYDHVTGLKPARVTGRNVPSSAKAPYEPDRADAAIDAHVADFVQVVRRRLTDESERIGRPAHVVAAFDTELFGHWWYEGPEWLARVLRALPEAGVRVGTLSDAVDGGFVGAPVDLPPSSWGSGKDWQVWAGDQVTDFVRLNAEVVDTALSTVDKALTQRASVGSPTPRDTVADQILRETLLTVSSDWPFMVSKDSAADYARYRAHLHAHATREIADALAAGRREQAQRLADGWNRADGLFGALDARRLPR
ncbi:1,4-alpha-glucan branching protein domain-containing protein [Mycolicibacterium monacense]|uniref:1,4-alpha-glucan branching enzyme n=2 Tax=Mycobacteriaceae TaxID=1762 RepID=A0AAD1IVY4_MYCMB|nr:glycoside hydrolase family 57 protein [Mycolicibacterium monacense]MDA4100735.1 1,4-alpha-glucan branching protein [Mycolicibacterium monacense DSM 44395]OBB71189.1 1,4-alpha-glucan branching protein [Mycolicibacterium monacense]ORB14896.1 1,4-alpha-glucan branching protein [Mycolicibacterium monacense DSM 44395]QHP85581.1 glycoside hydrolase family 57 protein [Mycolicibacterium monacense DSM 44395]BBZ61518.1 1,4-alpha-glucan-branching protein [Mycolicibacterium monacense]